MKSDACEEIIIVCEEIQTATAAVTLIPKGKMLELKWHNMLWLSYLVIGLYGLHLSSVIQIQHWMASL